MFKGVREQKEAAVKVVFESYVTLCQLKLPVNGGGWSGTYRARKQSSLADKTEKRQKKKKKGPLINDPVWTIRYAVQSDLNLARVRRQESVTKNGRGTGPSLLETAHS